MLSPLLSDTRKIPSPSLGRQIPGISLRPGIVGCEANGLTTNYGTRFHGYPFPPFVAGTISMSQGTGTREAVPEDRMHLLQFTDCDNASTYGCCLTVTHVLQVRICVVLY